MMKRKYGVDVAEDIRLDKYALDDEAEMTPSILQYWGELNAEARIELDKAEGQLKTLKAMKDIYYRRNPPQDLKTTETVFANLVETDEEVIKAKEKVYEWTEKYYKYYAIVDALHDKSNRVHDLIGLWEKGYYSSKN